MFNLTGLISASFAMKESARSSETRHPDRENESHPTLDARVVRTARAEPCRCDCDIAQCIAQSRENMLRRFRTQNGSRGSRQFRYAGSRACRQASFQIDALRPAA